MQFTAKQFVLGVAVTSVIGFSHTALAHVGGQANAGYVGDSKGHLVTDGTGHCLHTIAWTPALALEECDAGVAPRKVAAEPAPKAAPAPVPVPAVEKVTLKAGALFDSGKAALKPAGERELDDLAAKLKGMHGIESIEVTGYTDSQGAAAFNQKLSEQRAEAVKSYLVGRGVDGQRIGTRGMGPANPVASNATAEGRAQNRRVELDIKASQSRP